MNMNLQPQETKVKFCTEIKITVGYKYKNKL